MQRPWGKKELSVPEEKEEAVVTRNSKRERSHRRGRAGDHIKLELEFDLGGSRKPLNSLSRDDRFHSCFPKVTLAAVRKTN